MIDYEKIKMEIEDRFKDIDNAIARLRALLVPEPEDEPETWEQKHIKSILEFRRTECSHKSDDKDYTSADGNLQLSKCIKCGGFYR